MMLHFSFWAALAVLLARPSKAIIGGTLDDNSTFPSHGALMIDRIELGIRPELGFAATCSGALISDRVFLTAGHCVIGLFPGARDFVDEKGCPIDRYRTTRGGPGVWVSFDWDPDLTTPMENDVKCGSCLDVERVLIHPDYAKKVDIGVIILKDSTGREPIALPEEGLLDDLKGLHLLKDAEFLAVGYGMAYYDPPGKEIEPPDQRKYTDKLAYLSLDKRFFTLAMKPSQGLDGTCYGDSGGARFIKQGDDLVLVGITSGGDTPCVATDKVARVDTAIALDFLNGVINTVDSDNTCTEARYLE